METDYKIKRAVRTGQCPKEEAIDHVEFEASKIDLSSLSDHAYTKAKDQKEGLLKLAKDIQKISVLVESRKEDETNSSALLYLLAMLSERICRDPSEGA